MKSSKTEINATVTIAIHTLEMTEARRFERERQERQQRLDK
ncbi:MAG TPA: hypothetical protein VG759_03190 [Candidatus Angelobacter sp.]|nr:hypothetical protein [Candidatus Angelobacter sp.]